MRTFKQFLHEEDEQRDLIEMIEKDCAPFLKESGRKGLLFRGLFLRDGEKITVSLGGEKDQLIVNVKIPRGDRQPGDTALAVHNELNHWFSDNLGWKARSEAVFCYGLKGRKDASQYGTRLYVIFPVGDFKVTWSPQVDDLYYDIKRWHFYSTDPTEDDIVKIHEFMDHCNYKNGDVEAAVQSTSELMIKCSKYYAIDASEAPALMRLLKIE